MQKGVGCGAGVTRKYVSFSAARYENFYFLVLIYNFLILQSFNLQLKAAVIACRLWDLNVHVYIVKVTENATEMALSFSSST